jgi:hypothetical protein
MTEDDFRLFKKLVAEAGFTQETSRYDSNAFGSWFIVLSRADLPRQRLVWDGRDRTLLVETAASEGWFPKWFGPGHASTSALMSLKMPVTNEWLAEMERQRAEGWRTFYRKQALSIAEGLWEGSRYAEYVQALAPHIEELTPAQLKRLDLARNRADKD